MTLLNLFAPPRRRLVPDLVSCHQSPWSAPSPVLLELGKRADVINRLKIERDALKVELIELNAQLEALKRAGVINRLKTERDALKVERIELSAQLEALK